MFLKANIRMDKNNINTVNRDLLYSVRLLNHSQTSLWRSSITL